MDHLIVFGGKGGVGKSSISSSTAVYLANKLPEKKILLVSFDIAHNLSDLFEIKMGNDVTQITQNLFAIEPDPDVYTENYTRELTRKTRELFKSSFIMGIIPDLEEIIEDAIQGDNIPLAMKNSLFFQSILDAENPMADIGERQMKYRSLEQSNDTQYAERENIPEFDIVICDFPPTGNMIALFEIPADSTQRLMKLTLRTTSSITKSIGKLKKISKLLRPATWLTTKVLKNERDPDTVLDKEERRNLAQEILDILHDMEERSLRITQIMKGIGSLRLVSIAEKPSYEETKRARDLSSPYISVDGLHVNRLIPETEKGTSKFLDKIIANEDKYRQLLHQEFSCQKIWDSHLLETPPIGLTGLLRLAREVYGDTPVEDILNPLHRELHNPEKKDTYKRFRIDEFEAKLKNEMK